VLDSQEQRIRASHNIKKLSQRITEERLKVADRITKHMGMKPSSSRGARAAAAGGGSNSGSSSRSGMEDPEAKRRELAELIQKNGEELATSVEVIVEKVSLQWPAPFTCYMVFGWDVLLAGHQADGLVHNMEGSSGAVGPAQYHPQGHLRIGLISE
jgi:hypothetical protein